VYVTGTRGLIASYRYNTAPVADNQSVSTTVNTGVPITLTATDADEDPLEYSVVTGPAHGNLSGTSPLLTYTPGTDYSGPDSFTFEAYDGMLYSNTATVSITTNPSGPSSPYAVEVVDYSSPFGPSPYDDPNAVLGMPATDFYDPMGSWSGGDDERMVKLVEPAYNVALDRTTKLITTLEEGSYITVKFDHPVMDDPDNPYGIDLLVFGNAFYTGSGFVHDETNMNEYMLTGGGFLENVLVSVSQDGENWYPYNNGPYGDDAFPTHAYKWDAVNAQWTTELMDFTRPVNPDHYGTLLAGGISAADAIALYEGSGGGTGFDLAESPYEWIQYVKVEGTSQFGGEIDAFADVAPEEPTADWDLTGDGIIDIGDIAVVGMHWNETGTPGWIPEDLSPDGVIDIGDIAVIGMHWSE
jgi:hypothetical protein